MEAPRPATKVPLLDTKKKPISYSFDEEKISAKGMMEDTLVEQSLMLKAIYNKLFDDEAEKRLATSWRQLAIVCDRIFFVLTTVLVVSVSLAILLRKPPYDDTEWAL